MMMRLLLIAACLVASQAEAKCDMRDSWRGQDKAQHAAAGFAISMAATAVTKDPWQGFAWGAGAGLVKEAIPAFGGKGYCSFQDFAVTAIGAGFGSASGGYIFVAPKSVAFYKEF